MPDSQPLGYSAKVILRLHVNGDSFNVASVGPRRCILRNPKQHGPSDARLVVSIDGDETIKDVFLPNGISAEGGDVPYEVREPA